jgi:anti-anti-sigma factor
VRAVEGGATHIAIDVDEVGILDSAVISTLIAVLRDARARGASVELRAARQSILDTLRITALDKVFAICAPAEGSGPLPQPAKRTRRPRLLPSIAAPRP